MFGLIIYGEERACLYFTQLNFMVERQESKVPNCKVLFCFKPLRRNVLLAFYSLWCFFFCCRFSLVATLANGKAIFLRTVPQQKE